MTVFKPSDQTWAWIFVLTGMCMVLVSKHFGIATDIGAGVIGAGIQAYTASAKAQTNVVNSVVDSSVK